MTKKKILLVVTKSNFGGAQRYVFDLATHLPKDRFEPVVLCGSAQGSAAAGVLVEKLAQAGVRTIFIPALNRDVSGGDFAAYRHIARAIRAERPDVVHLNSSKAGGLGALAARLQRVPRIVFTSHGLAYDEPRLFVFRFVIFLATWLTFVLSHRVICISRDTAARAARLPFCRNRVHLIYNGIGQPDLLDRDEARKRLLSLAPDIPAGIPWIGTVGELVPNKGVAHAIRACVALRDAGKKFVFLVIGNGELEPRLSAMIGKHHIASEVRLLGYVPDAARILPAFDIFALTSLKEGLPYVLLEAGYARVPVVGSDIGGIRDIAEHDVSGVLVPPGDAGAIARGVASLIDDPAKRSALGSNLHRRVQETFSLNSMLTETAALY